MCFILPIRKEYLQFRKRYNQGILESAISLLNPQIVQTLSDEQIDRLVGFTWWYNNPSGWESAPLNSIVMGGGLFSISNPKLLQRLSELQFSLSDLKNVSKNDEAFHNDVVVPYYIRHANVIRIANTSKHAPGNPDYLYVFPPIEDPGLVRNRDLLTRPEFHNLLVTKIDKLLDVDQNYPEFEERLDDSILMIRTELAE